MSLFSQQLPQWDNVGVEPSGAKKTAGWLDNEKPPAGWFNWLFNRIYNCINEIRTVIDGSTAAPAGAMMMWPASSPPTGWIVRNGASLSRSTYAGLFAQLGTTYGAVDGSHFNIPDDRGYHERGWDNGRGIDPGRTFGSLQADDNKIHVHNGTTGTESATHTHGYASPNNMIGGQGSGGSSPLSISSGTTGTESATHTHDFITNSTGSTEVTVKNRAYLPIIKY